MTTNLTFPPHLKHLSITIDPPTDDKTGWYMTPEFFAEKFPAKERRYLSYPVFVADSNPIGFGIPGKVFGPIY